MPDKDYYAVLMRAARQVSRMQMQAIEAGHHSELSSSELSLLRCIETGQKKRPSGPTMSEIAAMLTITQGTLTVAVNRLVKKEYVQRVRLEQDRRVVYLSLTPLGKAALSEDRMFRIGLQGQFEQVLGNEEASSLLRQLDRLTAYFTALADKEDKA